MPLTPCTTEAMRLAGRVSGAFFPSAASSRGVDSAQEERLRQAVWRLRRSFATLSSGGLDQQLVELVRAFGARIDDLEVAVVAWVDVVEILVQEMECQQGRAAGSGHEKKAKVQAALFNLMLEMSQRGGRQTSLFAPLLFEAIADWSVDAVVLLLNRHELWQDAPEPTSSWLRRKAGAFFRFALTPFRWLRDLAARVVSRAVTARNPVSPELAEAISRIPSSGSLAGLLEDGIGFLTWVGRHRDQVVAIGRHRLHHRARSRSADRAVGAGEEGLCARFDRDLPAGRRRVSTSRQPVLTFDRRHGRRRDRSGGHPVPQTQPVSERRRIRAEPLTVEKHGSMVDQDQMDCSDESLLLPCSSRAASREAKTPHSRAQR